MGEREHGIFLWQFRQLGENKMVDPKSFFEMGLAFHGHKCPAMPMGLRIGAAAMNALGVERAKDGQLVALVEIGDDHCATCFADGIQVITGCTFGKGNIQKLGYGKWGVTLIEKNTRRAVRVTPKAEAMKANKQTAFFSEYREKGIPASKVPSEVVDPLIERVLSAPQEALLIVSPVFDYAWQDPPHSFESFVCEECGEMTVEPYGRLFGEKRVCIPCRQKVAGRA
ncbi:MAG: FmdE family protein [Candidatus Sumerlaeaceae bacterium]